MKEKEGTEQEELRERFTKATEAYHATLTAHDVAGEALHDEKRAMWVSLSTENYIRKNARKHGLSEEHEEVIIASYAPELTTESDSGDLQKENRELEEEQMMWQLLARANTETPFSDERVEAVRKIAQAMLILMEHEEEAGETPEAKAVQAIIGELGTIGAEIAKEDNENVEKRFKKMKKKELKKIAERITHVYNKSANSHGKEVYNETVAPKALEYLGVKA